MNKILFLDTLTTGLHTERCAIYRIGGIFCEESATNLKETQRFDLHVRPFEKARIMENSLWVGGVSRSRLIYFPDQKDAFNDFISLVEKNVSIHNPKDKIYIAGFNASSFDVPFLMRWFEMNNNPNFRNCFYVQTIDLMSLSAFALMNERGGMPDFHLDTAAKYLGVTPQGGEQYDCVRNAGTCVEMYLALRNRLHTGSASRTRTEIATFTNRTAR